MTKGIRIDPAELVLAWTQAAFQADSLFIFNKKTI
jgi:hypothetical protein